MKPPKKHLRRYGDGLGRRKPQLWCGHSYDRGYYLTPELLCDPNVCGACLNRYNAAQPRKHRVVTPTYHGGRKNI